MSSEFQTVSIADLRESKQNPRHNFSKKGLEELAASIKEHGVLTPLLVRPSNGHFEIAAGHRRFRAAKLAGLEALPAIVREIDDKTFLELLVIENLQREDVHPLEEAEGYRALMDKAGYDVETIAAKVGKSASYVYQRLKLSELIAPAKKLFLEGEITAGHAILLARLQPKDQAAALDECGDNTSVRVLADWIRRNLHLDLATAPWKKDDAALLPAAGACTTCPKRTGFNKALFADLVKEDLCTDRACFQKKGEAFLAIKRAELAADGTKVVEISLSYGHTGNETKALEKRGVLMTGDWRAAGNKKCPSTVTALVAEEGWNKSEGTLGSTRRVCTNKKCKVHRDQYGYSLPLPKVSARAKAKRQTDAAKVELEEEVLRAQARAVLAKVKPPLKASDLRVVAEIEARVYDGYGINDAKEIFGFEPMKSGAVTTATDVQVARFLVGVTLQEELDGQRGYVLKGKALEAAAKRWGVDLKRIEKDIREAATPKVQTSAKKKGGKKK